MEAAGSNSKHKPRIPYSDNSSRDGTSSNNGSQWHESHREHRRDHGKNRERGRDGEWNRDRPFHGKGRENSREEESQERFKEEQPQQLQHPSASFTAFTYTTDHSYVDGSQNNVVMPYLINGRPGWRVNSMDGMPVAQNNLPGTPSTSVMPTPMEMVSSTGTSMNPFNFIGVSGENGVWCNNIMSMFNQYGMISGQENVMVSQMKEVIHLTKSVLFPPNPNAPAPSTRGKPLGCKTIFVGGLPENITDEVIREIFERCGEIVSIRMSKKNFCHIRFQEAGSVEHALYYSGYRIKIDNKDEAPYTGRLHVDYAIARDDQHEYECQQRMMQRVVRHKEREYYRSVTPPVIHYTEHEATGLTEKLRNEESFLQAACILINWLDRGECTKRNAGTFYSMIQSTYSYVRQLVTEKVKYEDEVNKAKMTLRKQMEGITHQFYEVEKVFKATFLQKVWDHFTKAQRRNIEMWKKHTEEIKNAHIEEVINEREDEEMDLSDEENADSATENDAPGTCSDEVKNQLEEEIGKLRDDNDSLRCQLEVAQNDIVALQTEQQEALAVKECQMIAVRQAFQNAKKELLNMNQKRSKEEAELQEFRTLKCRRNLNKDDENQGDTNYELDENNLGLGISVSSTSSNISINENEARLIGLISTFLHVHPFGANIDYICSYLHQIDSSIKARDVENLMKRFQTVFREDSTGIGASLGKKWRFLGFQP